MSFGYNKAIMCFFLLVVGVYSIFNVSFVVKLK